MRQISILPVFITLLSLFAFACSTTPEKNIIGTWERTNHGGDPSVMVFHEDGTAEMMLDGMVLDRLLGGAPILWRMDNSRNPIHLDFILKRSGEPETIPMLVRFITPAKMQIQISKDMTARPSVFSPENSRDSIVLVKK